MIGREIPRILPEELALINAVDAHEAGFVDEVTVFKIAAKVIGSTADEIESLQRVDEGILIQPKNRAEVRSGGVVITPASNHRPLILVDQDHPDADGKIGLLLTAPLSASTPPGHVYGGSSRPTRPVNREKDLEGGVRSAIALYEARLADLPSEIRSAFTDDHAWRLEQERLECVRQVSVLTECLASIESTYEVLRATMKDAALIFGEIVTRAHALETLKLAAIIDGGVPEGLIDTTQPAFAIVRDLAERLEAGGIAGDPLDRDLSNAGAAPAGTSRPAPTAPDVAQIPVNSRRRLRSFR